MRYLLDRFSEPSTWRGVILLLTGFGITLSPETSTHIVAAGVGIAGLVGVLTQDNKSK